MTVAADHTEVAGRPQGLAFWREVVVRTVQAFLEPDMSLRCAGTAFFGFTSVFPAIGIAVLIYGLVADRSTIDTTIDALQYVLPDQVLGILHEQLKSITAQPPATLGIGLVISIALALWSGSRGVNALTFAMSRLRGAPERRGFIKEALVSIGLTIGAAIFILIALVTIAGLPALIPWPSGADWLVLAARWPILLVLSAGVMTVLYRFGPDRHPRQFRYIWPGAVLASVLWIVAGAIFSIYVQNWGNYQATFGSVAGAVVLLLWIYNSAQILVLGAAFNTELEFVSTGREPARPQTK